MPPSPLAAERAETTVVGGETAAQLAGCSADVGAAVGGVEGRGGGVRERQRQGGEACPGVEDSWLACGFIGWSGLLVGGEVLQAMVAGMVVKVMERTMLTALGMETWKEL